MIHSTELEILITKQHICEAFFEEWLYSGWITNSIYLNVPNVEEV